MKVKAWVDGGARGNPGPAGWGAYLVAMDGSPLSQCWGFLGKATNNVAEYQGLIEALSLALELGASEIEVRTDSQLIERQVKGVYRVKQPHLRKLYDEVKVLAQRFSSFVILHVPREENKDADALANRAMDERASGKESLV